MIVVISVIIAMRVFKTQVFGAWESSHEFQMYPSPYLCQLRLEAPLAALEFELRNVF